uniref:Uncharacterized protein n=1 Tax=Rhizophora mucronata TaxID=61149 RepID=A0A2P2PCT9_RHIMU
MSNKNDKVETIRDHCHIRLFHSISSYHEL